MNIGARIKELRTAKMMTQSELAGEEITRNMLSRIENGFATPSVQTLVYLASRLGVPAGFLLSGADEEFFYRKSAAMPGILKAFAAGDWAICSDLCRGLPGRDDETALITALCAYNSAREEFSAGNLRSALSGFERTCSLCRDTVYPTGWAAGCATAYLMCITDISPSLDTSVELPASLPPVSEIDPFCAYYRRCLGEEAFEPGPDGGDDIYSLHLQAREKMKAGGCAEALVLMRRILSLPSPVPAPMLYLVFTDMENCSRELEDFRTAYEYSSVRASMLERFLRQPYRTEA
jgi:transcriptional regulator with XRE-family HTH domain